MLERLKYNNPQDRKILAALFSKELCGGSSSDIFEL